jgi:hypothetical protein
VVGSRFQKEASDVRAQWWLEDTLCAVARLIVLSRLSEIPELAVTAALALDGYLPVEITKDSAGFVIQLY